MVSGSWDQTAKLVCWFLLKVKMQFFFIFKNALIHFSSILNGSYSSVLTEMFLYPSAGIG